MEPKKRLTIGVLARESGVPVRTLRFYEEQGLIAPLGRTPKGYRLYGPQTVEELAFLKGAKRLGLQLDDIGQLLRIRRAEHCPCGQTQEFVRHRLQEVENALGELGQLRQEMRRTLAAWEKESDASARPCRSIGAGPDAGP